MLLGSRMGMRWNGGLGSGSYVVRMTIPSRPSIDWVEVLEMGKGVVGFHFIE